MEPSVWQTIERVVLPVAAWYGACAYGSMQTPVDLVRAIFWSACLAVAYTLIGYPLIVAGLARLVPRPWQRATIEPRVSIVVAAYNEAGWIAAKLENTLALDYPGERLQVIVVADGSDDATPEIVRTFTKRGVELLHRPQRLGKADALNRAALHAKGEILIFTDANTFLAPDAIRHLVAGFADPAVAVITGAKSIAGGHQAFGRAEELYWHYEGWIRMNESLLGQTTGVNGELLAVRATDWRPLPTGTINDDFVIAFGAIAAGRRVVFEPRAIAAETSTARTADELARRRRMLAGRWHALAQLPRLIAPPRPLALWQVASHKLARALLPLFLGAASLANLCLVMLHHLARSESVAQSVPRPVIAMERLILAGQVLATLLAIARMAGLRLPEPAWSLAGVARYVLASQYAAAAGFVAWLRRTQAAAWEKAERLPLAGIR